MNVYSVDVSRSYYKIFQGNVEAKTAEEAIDLGLGKLDDRAVFVGGPDTGYAENINDNKDTAEFEEGA
jgi:hypothetical protein